MRVPEQLLRSVVFVGFQDNDGVFHVGGTAVVVGYEHTDTDDPERAHKYLVTARHNILNAAARGTVAVRVNLETGGGSGVLDASSGWVFPDDSASDLAVRPFVVPDEYLVAAVRRSSFVDETTRTDFGLLPGEDLAIVGLFAHRSGERANLPIVRMGSVAADLSERFEDPNTGEAFDAYLAEVRSIGGLSGSPAYVVYRHGQVFPGGHTIEVGQALLRLLGIIRGHWDNPIDGGVTETQHEATVINSGIALLTPIGEIIRLLDRDDFVRQRRDAERAETPGPA